MRRAQWIMVGLLASIVGRAGGAESPTFNKDVAPILFQHCSSCHRPDEVGPFTLLTYEDAQKRARQLARVTARRIMPPWKPERGHLEFQDARTLTAEQIAVFQQWAAAGAPEGEPADLPPQPNYPRGWHLGEPDLIVKVSTPFVVPAEGPDVYVHFVLPTNLDKDRHLRAVQVLPSNRRVAHHGVPILDGSGTARKLAAKNGGEHYQNFGGPGFLPRGFLPGYAPGMTTRVDESDDRGITLGKGIDIVLQMHYHPIGKEEIDQPMIGLYFTDKKPKRNPNVILMGTEDVDIPAGAAAHKRTDTFKVPVDFEVRDIFAHMHMIGKDVHVWAEQPDGTMKVLLRIPDWDFNWQDTYRYAESVVLPAGTIVKAEFTWDNTAENPRNPHTPPQRITLGENSTDEMAGLIIGGVVSNPWHELGMWIATIGHYFEVTATGNKIREEKQQAASPAPASPQP